jgi:hypothetical protein
MTDVSRATVCTKVLGGLGNQMFQFAAGLSLARHLGAELTVDAAAFRHYGLRAFALSSFGITCLETPSPNPSVSQAVGVNLGRFGDLVRRRSGGLLRQRRYGLPVITEPHFHFWEGFYDLSGSCYLDGYWQSALYFSNVEEEIRQRFNLSAFSDKKSAELERAIKNEREPVAVHVRRGDYVTDPVVLNTHGICEIDYYERARAVLKKLVEPSKFFIFSDNPELARQELGHWDDAVFVAGHGQEQDMMLMSLCRHNIIANSTFSWWAAWLNPNEEKFVVAPRLWFARRKMRTTSTVDLYPDRWIVF